jgi:hypothetical protein
MVLLQIAKISSAFATCYVRLKAALSPGLRCGCRSPKL